MRRRSGRPGSGTSTTYDFEREGKRPDGTPIKVAFSLAFAADPQAPDVGFFTCLHRHPENFWNPAFQVHPNAAAGVAGVVLVAENPTDHHIFLSALVGERDIHATSTGIVVPTPRGDIQVMDPAAFRIQFGVEPPDIARGARIAALRIAVGDFGQAMRDAAGGPYPGGRSGWAASSSRRRPRWGQLWCSRRRLLHS